jgi:hypothetical protein
MSCQMLDGAAARCAVILKRVLECGPEHSWKPNVSAIAKAASTKSFRILTNATSLGFLILVSCALICDARQNAIHSSL